MEIGALFFGLEVGSKLFFGGIGMGFLHMHLVNKGYAPLKIAAISLTTLGVIGAGSIETVARSGSTKDMVRQVRALGMFPFFFGMSGFCLGYGGTIALRRMFLFGKKHMDNYIQDVVKKTPK